MDWIEKLKVGDKVIVDGRHIQTITAVHKLHVVCGYVKYRKDNGDKAGKHGYYNNYIKEATPEAIVELDERKKRVSLIHYINRWKSRDFPTETLQKIADIIKDYENGLD